MPFSSSDRPVEAAQPVPHEIFQAEALPASVRFDVWREAVLPLFDCFPGEGLEAGAFTAQLEGYDLHRTFVSWSAFSPLRFRRPRHHPPAQGGDHVLVQLYLQGGYVGENGNTRVHVGAGDISLLDLGLPLATETAASQALSVVIPRDLMRNACGRGQWNAGTVLRAGSPIGTILSSHMLAVWHSLSRATVRELESINRVLVGAIAGAFATRSGAAMGPGVRVNFEAVCAYIQDNLEDRSLTAEHLCRRFHCSRSQLYRMFLPVGGVAAFIRLARLERCRDEFMSGRHGAGRIYDVAVQWGFDSQSHFCRLFRREFGMTPSEAIEQGRQLQALRQATIASRSNRYKPAFHHWLRQLHCAGV